MILRWLLAALHLLALGIGLGAVFVRGRSLRHVPQSQALQRVLLADNFWGLAALLWIVTGLVRAFGGFEKGSAYYLHNTFFWIKMALLVAVLALEIRPMLSLIRWRSLLRKEAEIDTSSAPRMARISYVQTGLIVLMVLAATAMARGMDL